MKTQRAVVGRGGLKTVLFFTFLISSIFCQAVLVPNDSNSLNPNMAMMAAMENSQSLRFDPNLYSFLVYDTQGSENSIASAMQKLGISYDLRTSGNRVTLADLQSHDILIVGWRSSGGDTSGLDPNILFNGITGRVLLSGHDADYHTAANLEAAETFLSQAIEYVLAGSGTGMITLGDGVTPPFPYLPDEWGVSRTDGGSQTVSSFTDEGLASGVYDNLVPGDMCNWGTSYHDIFTVTGNGFVSFELGGSSGTDIITVAAPINPMGFDLKKYDDVADGDCRNINDGVEYTIEWHNTTDQTFYDAYIKDIFPAGVTYPIEYSFDPNTWEFISLDPGYDEETHTYIYPIGTLDTDDSGILELDVVVNSLAEPGVYLHNVAQLWATVYDPNGQNPVEMLIATAFENTLACCWDTSGILYVDQNATGSNTGVSWQNAYTDLQDALTRARETHCTFDYVIYCAQGIYSPGDNENDSFILPPNISIYGGFPTGGCDFSLRNPKKYIATLSGKIDDTHHNNRIVTMGDGTLLDGFTVSEASRDGAGVFASEVDFTIENCTIEENGDYGAYIENGNATFRWSTFRNNDRDGIRHLGSGFTLTVENCWIRKNMQNGIVCQDSTPFVTNSVVTESDLANEGRAGIMLFNPTSTPHLQNVTVAHNKTMGVGLMGSRLPQLQNCIVYHNGGPALTGFSADQAASYSCIEDCNSVNNNISLEPKFAYFDPNNVRIMADSPCHDSGLTLQENYSQVDMDNRERVLGAAVDRGAYEIECEDTANSYDLNADGLVNLYEFNGLSKAWLGHDPNDPVWLADPNLADPNLSEGWYEWKYKYNFEPTGNSQYSIDLADLIIFLEDAPWLWKACWLDLEELQMQQMISGSGESLLALSGAEEMINSSQSSPVLMESSFVGMLAKSTVVQQAEFVPVEEPVQQEKPIGEQIAELQDSIEFLESIWNQDPTIQQEIDSEGWQEFMEALYQSLTDLQTETIQIE